MVSGRTQCVGLLALTMIGCERHVEEPIPPLRATDPSRVTTAVPQTEFAAHRCLRDLPVVPAHPADRTPDARCPRDPESAPTLRTAKVLFAGGAVVHAEVAESERDRERGLMYRKTLGDDAGMLFVFRERQNHAFWMHNTCISLDLLFIDYDGSIAGVQENAPTMSDDAIEVGCSSSYVLETNAGWARAHNIHAGQRADFKGL